MVQGNEGDLAAKTQICWIDKISGNNHFRRGCLQLTNTRQNAELREHRYRTAIEELLIRKITYLGLQIAHPEASAASNQQLATEQLTVRAQKQLELLNRLCASTCESLSKIRSLLRSKKSTTLRNVSSS